MTPGPNARFRSYLLIGTGIALSLIVALRIYNG
jgi:hypothetical protein